MLDEEGIELLVVLIDLELGSDPEDFVSMPGDLEAEREHRAAFHPKLRAVRTDLLSAQVPPPCVPHSLARPLRSDARFYDQNARVTLDIEYDVSSEDHPSTWDWTELLDLRPGQLLAATVEDLAGGEYDKQSAPEEK